MYVCACIWRAQQNIIQRDIDRERESEREREREKE
jgi:hypothetical protein